MSDIGVPLEADLSDLAAMLDREIPRDLWTIDQRDVACAAPQRIRLFGAQVPITPKVTCTLSGTVTRGAIGVHGEGTTIVADFPVEANVAAHGLGGAMTAKAHGAAMAHSRIVLSLARDWRLHGTVTIAHDWTNPPTIAILGLHIPFTDRAEAKLAPIVARLQRTLPAELERWNLRDQIASIWRQGFGVWSLNDHDPPVWLTGEARLRYAPDRPGP